MKVRFRRAEWEFSAVFRISYRTRTHAHTVIVELDDGEHVGRGEASGVSYHGETVDTLLEQVASVAKDLSNGASRTDLQKLLPAGGARSAIDGAFWDLEAKHAGRRVWELCGINPVRSLATTYTLSLDTPEAMGRAAADSKQYSRLKLKLDGGDDIARVEQVRIARPDARLFVDANQAWNEKKLEEFPPLLARLGVELIEQPLPAGKDAALARYHGPINLCADESCQTVDSLIEIVGKYQYVNIKLDKAGGLTEALQLARAARAHGLKLMVGCMAGSSLSIAPAFVVGQLCDVVDLDAPLLLKTDIQHAIQYESGVMLVPDGSLWG